LTIPSPIFQSGNRQRTSLSAGRDSFIDQSAQPNAWAICTRPPRSSSRIRFAYGPGSSLMTLIPATPALDLTPATLLVVDDDSSAREGLRSIFESAGHRTITVGDAPSALRYLRKQQCDLVMLDVELPEVDGLSLCRLLRAQPSLRQLPVLVFSATDNEQRKVEAFSAGADDYIVKPSSPGELLSRVNSHLTIAHRESQLTDVNRELRFLADLGHGLLQTLEPEQVARRVAGATFEGINAALCACVVKNNGHGFAVEKETRKRLLWLRCRASKPCSNHLPFHRC
jgi:DNA-binding response OmpR family regulator